MNLIFNEYIGFLHNNGVDLDLKEGYYWMDRMIIRAFDKHGDIHKIARIYIDDRLNMTYKIYDKQPSEIVSWQDIVNENIERLIKLEENALKLISQSLKKYKGYTPIVLTSSGKDSNVVQHLVQKCVSNARIVFNNTSLDCADTYKFAKAIPNVEILNPKEGFYQWRERNNFIPTRFARACCSIFKEDVMTNQLKENDNLLFFMGMRNDESTTRANYTDEWKNHKWSNDTWQAILPIREWTELDVWLYMLWKDVDINPKYKKGYARVGCAIACPYYTKSTWVLDKYWYPSMYDRWQRILAKDFTDNNKWISMNCTKEEYKTCWNGGAFRQKPTKEVIEEYAMHSKLDVVIAKNYFVRVCNKCSVGKEKPRRIRSKKVLAMNMKFLGRESHVLCKKCLKEYLGIDNEQWDKYVSEFENQGCELF